MTEEQRKALKKATDELCKMSDKDFYALLDKTEPLADARFMAGAIGLSEYPEDETAGNNINISTQAIITYTQEIENINLCNATHYVSLNTGYVEINNIVINDNTDYQKIDDNNNRLAKAA